MFFKNLFDLYDTRFFGSEEQIKNNNKNINKKLKNSMPEAAHMSASIP